MKRRALITGLTGQDGSYMADLLLEKDYQVYGLIRRTSTQGTWRIAHILDKIKLIPGDVTDQGSLERALKAVQPDEIYNFAAQSFVKHSFEAPVHTAEVTGLGTLHLLEAMRVTCHHTRFYQASSSEQFGNAAVALQDETTPFHPVSPYGAAKVFAHSCAQIYRKSYGFFITCGIAYNHESPRRGEEFVTRKITKAVAQIKASHQDTLFLGNTSSQRDWSHAKDVVRGAWMALQQEQPEDYVFASGITHSIYEFMENAFIIAGLDYRKYVQNDPDLMRPSEVYTLCGNASYALRRLGWHTTVAFKQLVKEMVDEDLARASTLNHHSLANA